MASTYLDQTLSTPTNNKIYTFSTWVKRSGTGYNVMLNAGSSRDCFRFRGDNDRLHFFTNEATTGGLATNRVFRDKSAWYHLVLAVDTAQATASDRVKIYVNGVQETSFAVTNYPAQNYTNVINSAINHRIGKASNVYDEYFDGQMAHVHFIDGTAYDADTFGETDATTGIWKPKTAPSVTYGTNGFFLKFENSGAFGTDSSGNSNTFTVNGTMTQTIDTPSNVFATLNALDNYYQADTLSNGNLTMVGGGQYAPRTATFGLTSGKWYWEIKTNNFESADGTAFGISSEVATASNYEYYNQSGDNVGYGYFSNGQVYGNASSLASGYGTGSGTHIIGVALDLDNNKIAWSYDGTWQGSADPSNGTNMISITAPSSLATGIYFPAFTQKDLTRTVNVNFGNGYFGTTKITSPYNDSNGIGLFNYEPPTNYLSLCTKSLNEQEYD